MSPTISMLRSDSSIARNSPSFSRTCSSRPSRSKTSRLASATAAHIGCPPHVKPWAKEFVPFRNGSMTRSEAIIAPIGAYLAYALELALRRREAAAGVLDGLHDHGTDGVRALELDAMGHRLGQVL